MNLDEFIKQLMWIVLFIVVLGGIFVLFKKLGVL